VLTFGADSLNSRYTNFVDSLSSALIRSGLWTTTKAGVSLKPAKSLSLSTGMQFQTIDIDNDLRPGKIEQHYISPLPFVDLTWHDLVSLSYATQYTEPDINQLISVRNNTDPLNQTVGNPALNPELTHTLGLSINHYDQQHLIQVYAALYGNLYVKAIVMARTVSDSGVQVTRPFNSDYSRNGSFYGEISRQYQFTSGWRLSWRFNLQGNWTRSLFSVNNLETVQQLYNLTPTAGADLNWKDKIIVDGYYTPTLSVSTYNTSGYQQLNYTIHNLVWDVSYLPGGRFFLESALQYQYNPMNSAFSRNYVVLWNASLNFRLLQSKTLLAKLSAFDLLNQNGGLNTQINQNYISNTQSSVLKRYFIFTLSYDLRNFGRIVKQ
jgi:hypothetical protein